MHRTNRKIRAAGLSVAKPYSDNFRETNVKSGKCPKCGSGEIYTKNDGFQRDVSVVMGCGYSESYSANLNDLKDVPAKWTKAGG